MVVLNSEFQFQNKDGSVIQKITIEQFWAPLDDEIQDQRCTRGDFDVFDPKVIYDVASDRWVVTTIFCRQNPGSGVFLAVSNTSNPTDGFDFYSIDADSGDTYWADYPSLGVNAKWIVISYNMFPNAAGGTFHETQLAIFEKAKAFDGTLSSFTRAADPGFTLVPVNAATDTGDAYLVTTWNEDLGCLRITRVTGTAASPSYASTSAVFPGWNGTNCAPAWRGAAFSANSSPQLGGDPINAGDDRMQTCMLRNGYLWCAHGIFLPASTGGRAAIQWWQFTPAGNIIQRGLIDDPSGEYHYTYPSLAVDAGEDVLVGFSRFASGEYPSSGYVYRASGDTPNTMRADNMYRPGHTTYVSDLDGKGRLRWGDYSATQVDPTDDQVFWTIQEFSSNHVASRNWGTWWARVDTSASGADTSPPTWPNGTSLTAIATSESEASLSWSAAQDNVGVTAYGVYIDGSLKGTVTGRSATVSGLQQGNTYEFRVEARDGAGNWSTNGPTVSLTLKDATEPTWPDKTLMADAQERQVTIGWKTANDNVGVAGYILLAGSGYPVDGVYYGDEVARVGPGARSFTVTGLEPGTRYVFWVEAFDEAGNISGDGPLKVRSTAMAFVDTASSVFADDIRWLSSVEVTRGCNPPANDRFCPEAFVTRGQMASFLVRALGLTSPDGFDYFVDDDESTHEGDINSLAFWEITKGCNPPFNNWYCPDLPVLRGQMASFLSRALLLSDGWNIDYFADDDMSVHEFDINRLAHTGITKGCNPPRNSLFCPLGVVTRGQMAAFLHRALEDIDAVRALQGLGPLHADEEATELGAEGVVAKSSDS